MRHLYIAGTDRWHDLQSGTLEIEMELTYQTDTCRFSVSGAKPNEGDEVIVEDDDLGRLFGGIIQKVELESTLPDRSNNVWACDCMDYTALLDKKLVTESYTNTPADVIFRDIAAKYCPDFTVDGVRSGAPVVEEMPFNYIPPSEAFKKLCDYIGWHWQPSYYKDLAFFSVDDITAPAPLKLTPGGRFSGLKHSINKDGLRNRIYVVGGTMLSDPFTYEIKADGVARTWPLPHSPHNLKMYVGGAQVSVGQENVDDENTFDYMYNFDDKYVKASAWTDTIPAGTTITFVYQFDMDVITIKDDTESQAALAAVEGGDGVYEYVITDDSLTTLEAAEAAADAELRDHANPSVSGSFDTDVPGWAPGQLVEIDLPDRGISGTFLVQKVTVTREAGRYWAYHVEYGGRLKGIADVLKALVSAQQNKKLSENTILHKIVSKSDTATVADEIITTSRAPGWKAEESLALDISMNSLARTESTQADFQSGTLTNVVVTSGGDLKLQSSDVGSSNYVSSPSTVYNIVSPSTNYNQYTYNHTNPNGGSAKSSPILYAVSFDLQQNGSIAFSSIVVGGKVGGDSWDVRLFPDGTVKNAILHSFEKVPGSNGYYRWKYVFIIPTTSYLQTFIKFIAESHDYNNINSNVQNVQLEQLVYNSSGTRISPSLDLSAVGIAASSAISWNADVPANTSLVVETSLDGGQTWQQATNGREIPGIAEGMNLAGKSLLVRQTLTTSDPTVTPSLHDITVSIEPEPYKFATVGSLLNVWQPGSDAWAQPQYQISTDGGQTWGEWQDVDPAQRGYIELPHPCRVRLKANGRIQARNWKKPFDETDAVCGFVQCG